LATLGLAAYAVVFFAGQLPSLPARADGAARRRVDFFEWLLIPDELVSVWFQGTTAGAWLDRMSIVLVAITMLAVAMVVGAGLLRLVVVSGRLTRVEHAIFSLAVGLNVVSLYTLAVGLAGLLRYRAVFIAPGIVVIGIGVARWYVASRAGGARHDCLPQVVPGDSLPWHTWRWFAAPLAFAVVLGGMMPPVEFDVREYHLQAPKEFYQSGSVHFLAHNVYGNMPLGAEMLATAGMSTLGDWWRGALVGKLLIAMFALLAAVDLWALTRRYVSTSAGASAAIAYLSTPWVLRVSMLGLIECAVGCFTITAIHALLIWREDTDTADDGLLATAGFLAGAAVACKYPALLMTVVPLTVFVILVAKRRGQALVVFLAAVTLGCGLWFAKNHALTGNPAYPLLSEVLDGVTRTPEKIAQWQAAHRPPNFAVSDATESLARALWRSEWLGLLVAPLAVAGVVFGRRRPLVWLGVAYLVFVFAAWWLMTHRIDRFLLPALPVAALLAGVGVSELARLVGRHVMTGVVAVACLYALLVATTGPAGDNRYFAALQYLRDDPRRVTPWRSYLNDHARDLGIDARRAVLALGDAEAFDFEVPVTYHTTFDDCPLETMYRTLDEVELHRAIRARFSYIYVNYSEIERYRSPGNYGYTQFIQPELFSRLETAGVLERPIDDFADAGVVIYHVAPAEK
jgi:hypothetical protein